MEIVAPKESDCRFLHQGEKKACKFHFPSSNYKGKEGPRLTGLNFGNHARWILLWKPICWWPAIAAALKYHPSWHNFITQVQPINSLTGTWRILNCQSPTRPNSLWQEKNTGCPATKSVFTFNRENTFELKKKIKSSESKERSHSGIKNYNWILMSILCSGLKKGTGERNADAGASISYPEECHCEKHLNKISIPPKRNISGM